MLVAFARGDKLNYHSAKHIIETVRLQLRTSPNVSRLAVPAGGKITGMRHMSAIRCDLARIGRVLSR